MRAFRLGVDEPSGMLRVEADPPLSIDLSTAAERDLYLRLLELGEVEDAGPFLDQLMGSLQAATGAELVFIGVFEGDDLVHSASVGMGADQADNVLQQMSTGILRSVLQSSQPVQLSSAMLDARFEARASVRRNRIEAVLCSPVAWQGPLKGILYLQRHAGEGPFPPAAVRAVERIARHLPSVSRSLDRRTDPTSDARARLAKCDLVGRSPALARLLQQVAAVGPLDIDVLVTGPSGTGKSHVARLLHDNSSRRTGPFVAVNCAAVQDGLFESVFFGHVAGSFTGSQGNHDGHVGAAQGGTLFLDEIADLSLAGQAKILQLLQERVVYRVGESRPRRVDVRIVAATNADLDEAVRNRSFREDLRYRLEVVPLKVPGLTERRGDIRSLAEHFRRRSADRHGALGDMGWSPSALASLENAEWPGHVRQLQHVVEAGMVRAHAMGRTTVEPADLFPNGEEAADLSWQGSTRRFQKELLATTLRETGWNVAETARKLDLARSRTYELVRAFGLQRPSRGDS